jgi:predicted transcriptional regulator of viral defense system
MYWVSYAKESMIVVYENAITYYAICQVVNRTIFPKILLIG